MIQTVRPTVQLLTLLSFTGCTTTDPLYCDQNHACTDPARPFCDLVGEYPASDGVARTCIPDPNEDAEPGNDSAVTDAGPSGDSDGGLPTDATAPCTDQLAFVVSPLGSNPQIYVSDADGSNLINLTQSPSANSEPAWSPDGSRLAFVRDDAAIWTMNADGSDPIQLIAEDPDNIPSNLRWSPDGTHIVFVRSGSSGPVLWTIEASGGEPTALADEVRELSRSSLSPDGTKIAFPVSPGGARDVFTIDSDGTELTNRTNNPADDTDPAWSPDGEQILFTSNRDGNSDLWLMTADGNNPRNLTNAPEGDSDGQFLPDGSTIIYVRNGDLFSMNADGTAQQQITFPGEAGDGSVAISPDGVHIAWNRSVTIDGQITEDVFVANMDGSAAIRLTPEGSRSPAWRPCPR